LVADNNRNLLLSKISEDWYPYCDNVNEYHKAAEMINIFENFSNYCALSDIGFDKRIKEVA
jgi:hypothetical protein